MTTKLTKQAVERLKNVLQERKRKQEAIRKSIKTEIQQTDKTRQ